MVYSIEQNNFMTKFIFARVNDEWFYSLEYCLQEFQRQSPQVIVDYNFRNVLDRTVTLFRLEEEKCNRRPTKRTPEVVDAVEEIIESGIKLPLLSSTCECFYRNVSQDV
jgi:hypothetical protein